MGLWLVKQLLNDTKICDLPYGKHFFSTDFFSDVSTDLNGRWNLVRHHLYYLPRHGINTADCYRCQRDVLGTQLQSHGYVKFYCLKHIHQPVLRRAFLRQETPNNVDSQTNHARSPLADRLAISGDCPWNALTVTGKVMITWGFSISARCMMISIPFLVMMRILTWPCADHGVSMLRKSWMMSPARIASWRSWITMSFGSDFSSNITKAYVTYNVMVQSDQY